MPPDPAHREPDLDGLASAFGGLLAMALKEYVDLGEHAGRRLDDLLLGGAYDPARDGRFSGWVKHAEYAAYQHGEPFPPHRDVTWPLLVIQTAIDARDPERIAEILDAEVAYELEKIAANEWVDEAGNPARLDDDEVQADQLAAMTWATSWRRTFGGSGA